MTLASAALAYSERLAWAVLPLRGKVPVVPKGRGYLDATTDPATISRWWREYPDANVGVSCIGSNLVVLDVDPGTAATGRWPNSRSATGSCHPPSARSPAAVASTSCSTPSVIRRPARSARALTSSGAATSSPPRVSTPTPAGAPITTR